MRRTIVALLLGVMLSVGLSTAQEHATLSSFRILPASGKDAALKKAIAAHAAKYHTGNWKWRVFNVLSGADEGSYMINEGPNSWTDMEGRKDISDEHTRDFETSVLPLAERTLPHSYLVYQKDVSSDSARGPMKKALLRHFYLKPGKGTRMYNHLATWKKVWEKLGLKVGVWTSFYSGQPRIIVSYRLPQGFVDLEQELGKKMRETFDEFAGTGAHARYLEDLDQWVDRIDEEVIELMPELGSK
jgi:hypothetical protein